MTSSQDYDIRDPIHDFVRLDSDEGRVLDSPPVQRLRHIHQLAMSYLVYPGTTHKRFEHSLGVMQLAGRVFDVVTEGKNIHPGVRGVFPDRENKPEELAYWRKVVRMAALCHDIGHLPFSHAAERELLPEGVSHETLTADLIQGDDLNAIWKSMRPPLVALDIAKVAAGQEKMPNHDLTTWETLLHEIIGGDALGADRMDYLLRDSHHAGVAYGRFDHYRLVDTLRILPASEVDDTPALGIEVGGIHSSEALLLARYFMFKQVYLHRIRVAFDYHLMEFLKATLSDGLFPTDLERHQSITDNEVLAAIAKAARDSNAKGHEAAARIVNRNPFKELYAPTREENEQLDDPLAAVYEAATEKFGANAVCKRQYPSSKRISEFPVRERDGRIQSSHAISDVIPEIPKINAGVVLVAPEVRDKAVKWFDGQKDKILKGHAGEKE